MKTIADFKRKMVIGANVEAKLYYKERGTDEYRLVSDFGTRPVSVIQSNCFAFKTTKVSGETVNSWCDWPKKNDFHPIDENTVKITFDGGYLLYKFV